MFTGLYSIRSPRHWFKYNIYKFSCIILLRNKRIFCIISGFEPTYPNEIFLNYPFFIWFAPLDMFMSLYILHLCICGLTIQKVATSARIQGSPMILGTGSSPYYTQARLRTVVWTPIQSHSRFLQEGSGGAGTTRKGYCGRYYKTTGRILHYTTAGRTYTPFFH